MPHVIVKMTSGRSEAQKQALTDAITKAVMEHTKVGEPAVSVAIEIFEDKEWTPKVYNPDILPHMDKLYKKPGYKPS